jgi:hypothetical protein
LHLLHLLVELCICCMSMVELCICCISWLNFASVVSLGKPSGWKASYFGKSLYRCILLERYIFEIYEKFCFLAHIVKHFLTLTNNDDPKLNIF